MLGIRLTGALALSGCALPTRVKTVDVDIPATAERTAGAPVAIVKVEDLRLLTSLEREQRKTGDPNIRARAYGDKGVGTTAGTIVLPPGRTVADVVGEAVEEGFRRAGYAVVDGDRRDLPDVIPVEVAIGRFWTWKDRRTHFAAKIAITAPVEPFREKRWIATETIVKPRSYLTLTLMRLDTFRAARKKGVEELIEEIARVARGGDDPS